MTGSEQIDISIAHQMGDSIEQNFYGDWRLGKEIRRIIITRRLYQVSPYETKS